MTPLTLSKRMNIELAFQAIVFHCVEQIEANKTGVAQEYEAESLHQMRVGLRRLSSALDLFKNSLQLPNSLQQELDWLSTQLSSARDWDVLTASTLPAIVETLAEVDSDKNDMSELMLAAMSKAHEQHIIASVAVRSRRYTALLLAFRRWAHDCGWRDSMSIQSQYCLQQDAKKFASNAITQNHRRLLKRGKKLSAGDVQTRHRVRIAAKRLRYVTEFFYSLHSEKKIRVFLKVLARFQDELGRLNDMEVANQLLEKLAIEHIHLINSINFMRKYLTAAKYTDDKKINKLWRKIATIKHPFQKTI